MPCTPTGNWPKMKLSVYARRITWISTIRDLVTIHGLIWLSQIIRSKSALRTGWVPPLRKISSIHFRFCTAELRWISASQTHNISVQSLLISFQWLSPVFCSYTRLHCLLHHANIPMPENTVLVDDPLDTSFMTLEQRIHEGFYTPQAFMKSLSLRERVRPKLHSMLLRVELPESQR